MLQVTDSSFVEPGPVLPGTMGKAVSRQIHQPPAFVDREDVNQLGEPRRRRDAGHSLLAREHVQQRGLADVRAADKGELRQRLVRTRIQIRRAAIKNGGCDVHDGKSTPLSHKSSALKTISSEKCCRSSPAAKR